MEQLTKQLTNDAISTGRMWRNYALGWVLYMLMTTTTQQADNIAQHRFDWHIMAVMFAQLTPQGLILALHWPLSGWFERKRVSLPLICLIHLAGALAFAALSYGPVLMTSPNRSMAYNIWPIFYFIMGYGIVATMFQMVRANAARQRQAVAIQQAHSLLIATELNALRNKLNPHFLFNTLHSIIALTRKDPDAAETALFQFSDMLRYVLNVERNSEKNGDRVTLEDELAFVRDYLELESLRLGERLNIAWELDDDAGRHALPALSLQPLVENSIKHAFNPHSRPGHLLIRTRVDAAAGKLAMTVGDDGPGADLGQVRASNGLGIRTVERRLQLEYGPAGALAIETAPGAGFVVTMSVPLAANQ